MKSLFSFLSLVLIAGSLSADVPVERKLPQLPPNDPMLQELVLRDQPASPLEGMGPRIGSYVDRPGSGPFRPAYPPRNNAISPNGELTGVGSDRPAPRPRSIMPVLDPRINDPRSVPRFEYPVEPPVKSPDRGLIGIADDVPAPRRFPQYPPSNLNPDQVSPDRPVNGGPIAGPRYVMPVEPPVPGSSDRPNVGHPDNQGSDFPLYVGYRDRGPDAGPDMTRPGPSIRMPGPIFRNLIQVHLGPGARRIPVTGRLFDMNGRLVYSERVRGGPDVTFSGARIASLPAGNYVLQLDCGEPSKYVVRLSKAE